MAKKLPTPPIPPPWLVFDGPSLLNVVFTLKSLENAPTHFLRIMSQTSISRNFAFIQGTWQGDGPTPKQFIGTISDGTIRLTCSWARGDDPNIDVGRNTLMGTVFPADTQHWVLVGNVVATDAEGEITSGGPGMVTGEGVFSPSEANQ
jgi:hypothetical protein